MIFLFLIMFELQREREGETQREREPLHTSMTRHRERGGGRERGAMCFLSARQSPPLAPTGWRSRVLLPALKCTEIKAPPQRFHCQCAFFSPSSLPLWTLSIFVCLFSFYLLLILISQPDFPYGVLLLQERKVCLCFCFPYHQIHPKITTTIYNS